MIEQKRGLPLRSFAFKRGCAISGQKPLANEPAAPGRNQGKNANEIGVAEETFVKQPSK
jgi:hypothetical protein